MLCPAGEFLSLFFLYFIIPFSLLLDKHLNKHRKTYKKHNISSVTKKTPYLISTHSHSFSVPFWHPLASVGKETTKSERF